MTPLDILLSVLGAGGLATIIVAFINTRATRDVAIETRAASESATAVEAFDRLVKALQAEVERHADELRIVRADLVSCSSENKALQAKITGLENRLARAATQLSAEVPPPPSDPVPRKAPRVSP